MRLSFRHSLQVKAVIFDFDDTIVDSSSALPTTHKMTARSIETYLKSRNEVINFGFILSMVRRVEEHMQERRIYDRDIWWRYLLREMGITSVPDEIIRRWTFTYWDYYSKGRVFDDAEETLSYLKDHGYKLGMVTDTDGTLGIKKRRLESSGLLHYFETIIVAGEDVDEVKPNPKAFLLAANNLGVSPGSCLVVGDKLFTDIQGAKNAGMLCALLSRKKPPYKMDPEPDIVIDSLRMLTYIL